MRKSDIEEAVYEAHGGLTRKEVDEKVALVLDLIRQALADGDRVKLKGFGILSVVSRRGKRGRHPKTGLAVDVKPRKTVVFRVSRNSWAR